MIHLEEVKNNGEIQEFIKKADKYLEVIGYTEHGSRHSNIVAGAAKAIMLRLGYSEEEAELAAIAGYLHDIGNVVNRDKHPQTGAIIAYTILHKSMPPEDLTRVIAAIGNHEEPFSPTDIIGAAMVIADKADVHRSRVKNRDKRTFDIHDRVNYAVEKSYVYVSSKSKIIRLDIMIDTKISNVMDYFEIFLDRMNTCKKAAKFLGCQFDLVINKRKLD